MVGGNDGPYETPQVCDVDLESLYSSVCEEIDQNMTVIVQNTQKLSMHEELFYTDLYCFVGEHIDCERYD